jgi:hypothetical protein
VIAIDPAVTTADTIAGTPATVITNVCAAANCGKSTLAVTAYTAVSVAGTVYTSVSVASGRNRVAAVVPVAVVKNGRSTD